MKMPPLLMGATLLFWGWQTGMLAVAIPMAAALEGSRILRARWELSQADWDRIWNLCTILFFGSAIFAFVSNEGAGVVGTLFEPASVAKRTEALARTGRSLLLVFQWLPLAFLPIMVAQAFCARETIDYSTFSWFLRRRRTKGSAASATGVAGLNVSAPYFGLCLIATSAGNGRGQWFYWGLAALLAWALWPRRSQRFSTITWGASLAAVVVLGWAGHLGLFRLQKIVERLDASFLSRFYSDDFDPKHSRTALGSIGRLKLSGRIVLRLETRGEPPPTLLREASYNLFRSPLWHLSKREFRSLVPETDGTTWKLIPDKNSHQTVIVARYLNRGAGLLALPRGASQLQDLPALLENNPMGAVKVGAGPGLISYTARYDAGATIDGPPDEADLLVPEAEDDAVSRIAAELGLALQTPVQAMRTISAFFQGRFRYATYLGADPNASSNQTALAAFLLSHREGHCEYFATATVMLLRKANVPSRYAVGYSVQEGSRGKFVVRERHAHAWCLVYLDGVWQDFDTTPASWNSVESQRASFWEPFSDAWSRMWFEFSRWRWSRSGLRTYAVWLVLLLFVVLAVRLIVKNQWARFRPRSKEDRAPQLDPGLDSEFYLIERRLTAQGLVRRTDETVAAWGERISVMMAMSTQPLREILALHYRHRFDPAGLDATERAALKEKVHGWLGEDKTEESVDRE